MLGAFGLILDLLLILFGIELLGLAAICGIFKILPKTLEWICKLLVNPAFWIFVAIVVFVL